MQYSKFFPALIVLATCVIGVLLIASFMRMYLECAWWSTCIATLICSIFSVGFTMSVFCDSDSPFYLFTYCDANSEYDAYICRHSLIESPTLSNFLFEKLQKDMLSNHKKTSTRRIEHGSFTSCYLIYQNSGILIALPKAFMLKYTTTEALDILYPKILNDLGLAACSKEVESKDDIARIESYIK